MEIHAAIADPPSGDAGDRSSSKQVIRTANISSRFSATGDGFIMHYLYARCVGYASRIAGTEGESLTCKS